MSSADRRRTAVTLRLGMSRLPVLLSAVLLFVGCSLSGGRRSDPFTEGGGEGRITIRVQNQNFSDATLHALSTGGRIRLGTVTGNSSGTFHVPWRTLQTIRIEIDLLGASGSFTTRGENVSPGESLELTIASNLRQSRLIR